MGLLARLFPCLPHYTVCALLKRKWYFGVAAKSTIDAKRHKFIIAMHNKFYSLNSPLEIQN